jgi:putative transposase
MAYPLRNFIEGHWYHLYTRGQRREPLFFASIDRVAYLSFLDRELSRRDGQIGSYCLMTNHVHFLVKMESTPLNEIFQTVHMKYAKYFNVKRGTKGHVFQGRPGIKMVLDDSYLLQLAGYIHRNPVEAEMVETVMEYEWSSWRWFVEDSNVLNVANGIYPPGFRGPKRRGRFLEQIKSEHDLPDGENYWGTEDEWEQVDRRKEGREGRKYRERRNRTEKETIAEQTVKGTSYTVEELRGPSRERDLAQRRREAMGRMYEEGYQPTEIGKWFNRTPSAVVHAHDKWSKHQE